MSDKVFRALLRRRCERLPSGQRDAHLRLGHGLMQVRINVVAAALDMECHGLETGLFPPDFKELVYLPKQIRDALDFCTMLRKVAGDGGR